MNKVIQLWNSRSEAAKSAVVFTLAILLSRGISIISTPIFTRIMPTDQIGIVGLFISYLSIISAISSLALNSGGFMVGLKDFSDKRDEYVSSVVTLTTITSGILLLFLLVAPSFWSKLFGLPVGLLFLLWFGCMVTPAYEFWLMRQRYEYAYKKAALITVLTSVFSTLLAVFAVIAFRNLPSHLGEIRLYVATGSSLLVYLVIWVSLLRKGRTFINKQYWAFSLALSLPLLGHSFASQMLSVSDRFFISKYIDNSAVGIYSTLYSVGFLSLVLWGALNSSFIPYLFQNIDKIEERNNIRKNTVILLLGFSIVSFFVALMTPEIVRILAPKEYYDNVFIVPPMIVGAFFIAVGNIYSNLLVYCKNTIAIMVSSLLAGAVSIVLNIIFIPKYGFAAAAYNSLFSYIIFALFQSVFSYHFFKKKIDGPFVYNNFVMIAISIITVVTILCCSLLYNMSVIRYIVAIVSIPIILTFYFKGRKYLN